MVDLREEPNTIPHGGASTSLYRLPGAVELQCPEVPTPRDITHCPDIPILRGLGTLVIGLWVLCGFFTPGLMISLSLLPWATGARC